MIWGMRLQPGQELTHQVRSETNLTLASLDCRPEWTSGDSSTAAYLLMKTKSCENVICTLERGQTNQQQLDLVLQPGEEVTFKVEGNGLVYLTGYSSQKPDTSKESSAGRATEVRQTLQPTPLNPPARMDQSTSNIPANQSMLLVLRRYAPILPNSSTGHAVRGTNQVQLPLQQLSSNRPVQMAATSQRAASSRAKQPNTQVTRQLCTNQPAVSDTISHPAPSKGQDSLKGKQVMPVEGNSSTDMQSRSSEENRRISEDPSSNMSRGRDNPVCQPGEDNCLLEQGTAHAVSEEISGGPKVHVPTVPGASGEIQHTSNDSDSGDDAEEDGESDVEAATIESNDSTILTPDNVVEVETESGDRCDRGRVQDPHTDTLQESGHSSGDASLEPGVAGSGEVLETLLESGVAKSDQIVGDQLLKSGVAESGHTPGDSLLESDRGRLGQVCQDQTEFATDSSHTAESSTDRPTQSNEYKCQLCDHVAWSQEDIESHEKAHPGTAESQTRDSISVSETIPNDSGNDTETPGKSLTEVCNRPFKCQYCDKSFKRKSDLGVHARVHTVEPSWKCQHCDKSYRSKGKLAKHERAHTRLEASLDCDVCGKRLSSIHSLKKHKIFMHSSNKNDDSEEARPFKCQLCGKGFKRKQNCKEHEIIHTDKHLFQCSFCHKTLRGRSNWRKHEKVHRGERLLYECKICKKSMTLRSFKKHEGKHKDEVGEVFGEGNWPFKCKFCEETFKTTGERLVHQKMHSATAMKCQYCGKIYTQEKNFRRHVDQHLGKAAPFQCGYCGKTFTCPQNGRRHERRHVEGKPFKCRFCDKRFCEKSQMLSHEGHVHTHVKPFKCQYCKKAYYASENLRIHMRVHTGHKPYQCQYCGEAFAFCSKWKVHESKHSKEEAKK